ncbi:MAG TPA: acyl-CoA dehydrogenase family protein [Acidimicrobiales bacterium]|nr:acyl-CoA dehydrogenase family protein [Acidimicrobiales bacterium]
MDFGFGEDQELLRSTTRRFLTEHQSLAEVRRRMEEPELFDAGIWRQGAELGWTAMLIPGEYEGGSVTEQPLVDLVVLAEELGRELNPGPFVPCNVVADAIARFGTEVQGKEHLPRIALGELPCAWCLSGDGSPEPTAVDVRATRVGEGWILSGVARYVHAAGDAALLLVTANDTQGDGFVNLLVPRPTSGLSERVLSGLDLTRRFAEVHFDAVSVPGTAELAGGWSVVDRCLSVATVLQSAESVGAADRVFASTVDYAKKRVQFGRTIGSFQAIKHRLANLLIELEGMRAAAHYAALALGDGLPDAAEAVATAGAYVDDTFAHLCGEALQLHGGIGFTWEHDVHLFVRRAKVNQVLYGDGAWHRERLVRLVEADLKQVGEA